MAAVHELPLLGVDSLEDVDGYGRLGTDRYQFFVAEHTGLTNAVAIQARMRAGAPGQGFKVFNPELVARKVEAEAALRVVLERVQRSITKATVKLAATKQRMAALQAKIDLGGGAVRVGPSINRRALPFQQVLYPNDRIIPEGVDVTPPPRRLSRNSKMKARGLDAISQLEFWALNLRALESKQAALIAYLHALIMSRDELEAALHVRTRIGCGYSDYTFLY